MHAEQTPTAQQKTADEAEVESSSAKRLTERSACRSRATFDRPTVTVLRHPSHGREERVAGLVVPIEARAQDAARIARQIHPAVAIDVLLLLPVSRSEEGIAPVAPESAGGEAHRVCTALRGLVHHDFWLAAWTTGHEVHHPAECRAAAGRRSRTLDDLDLSEVQRRHLQQTERVWLLAIQRQLVRQDLRVAAAQPPEPQLGPSPSRDRRLHAQPSELVEQGREGARGNRLVIIDLFL